MTKIEFLWHLRQKREKKQQPCERKKEEKMPKEERTCRFRKKEKENAAAV